jgi:hypothetical protein
MESIEPPGIVGALSRIQDISSLLAPPVQAAPAQSAPTGDAFAQQLASASLASPAAAPGTYGSSALLGLQGLGGLGPGVLGAGAVGASAPAGAQELDAWMAQKVPGSPLVGMGAVFVREGQANGIDPRFLVAVAYHESVLGTAGSGRDINNAFGWGPAIPFSSWEENIATVAEGLADGYVGEGLTTVGQIQGKWAPVGAGNDPSNLNSNWLDAVSKTLVELGGDPGGSVLAAPAQPAATAASWAPAIAGSRSA